MMKPPITDKGVTRKPADPEPGLLPPLAAGIHTYQDVQHVRTTHLIDWLEDCQDSIARDMIAPGDLLSAIRDTLIEIRGRSL